VTLGPDTQARIVKRLAFAMSVKGVMLDEGLRTHTEACPFCDQGNVVAALAKRNDHLVMACSTPGCVSLRE
jgi:hypothetical protein